MSRQTVIRILCDMPHDGEVEASTYTISTPDETREVDLCDVHAVELVIPLVEVGRTVRASSTRKPQRVRVRGT